jgi:hypothetical protein
MRQVILDVSHLLIYMIQVYIYIILDHQIKDKIFKRIHEINGKIVDVKLSWDNKDQDISKKIYVGGIDLSVTESKNDQFKCR